MEPEIDVLLITYNGGEFLAAQLDSILDQTYPFRKLLIFDDASVDTTYDILSSYQQDPRVEVVFREKNLGIIQNLQAAILHVDVPWIALADQDDIWEPNKLEQHAKLIRARRIDHERKVLLFSDASVIDARDHEIHQSFYQSRGLDRYTKGLPLLTLENFVIGCTTLVSRSLLEELKYFKGAPKGFFHDEWFAFIALTQGVALEVDGLLVKRRMHQKSQTLNKSESKRKWYDRLGHSVVRETLHAVQRRAMHLAYFLKVYPDQIKETDVQMLKQLIQLSKKNKWWVFMEVKRRYWQMKR
jgi:glycosyltransferase involved in cell wall biosynthesis